MAVWAMPRALAVMVGPVPAGLARIAWSSSSSQRRTTLSPLEGPSPMIEYSGGGLSGSGGPAAWALTVPPNPATATPTTTTSTSPRPDRTRIPAPAPATNPPPRRWTLSHQRDRANRHGADGWNRSPSSLATRPSATSLTRWARTDSSAAGCRAGSTSA